MGYVGDLYSSSDGEDWTYDTDTTPAAYSNTGFRMNAFLEMAGGTYRQYSQLFFDGKRQGGMGTSTNYNQRFIDYDGALPGQSAESVNAQVYANAAQEFNGNWFCYYNDYSSGTETAHGDLQYSRDGIRWVTISEEWIPLGGASDFDSKGVYLGHELVHAGNDWRMYYSGTTNLHEDTSFTKSIGFAHIGYQRIGQVASIGTFTTHKVKTTGQLIINTEAEGGSVTAEVIDMSNGAVIPGYAHENCDAVTNDTFAATMTWGGNSLPVGSRVEIEFSISNAILYAYSVGLPSSQTVQQGDQ